MELASLLETCGDTTVLAAAGALVGFVFGLTAQRTRFCTRAAVIESCQGQLGPRFAVWWLGFSACWLAVQILVMLGALQPQTSRMTLSDTGSKR